MPIYEYRCEPCDHPFETLIRSRDDVPHCPKCGNVELAKQFSVPAAVHSGGSQAGSLPVCDTGPASFGCGGGRCMTGMCETD